jgi:lysyl-tRNA synthetase class 2
MSDATRAGDPPGEEDEGGSGRLHEALAARRQKLERLRARGVAPFAPGSEPDRSLAEIRAAFPALEPGAETGERVRVAGRIVLLRRHGKLSFATIRDRSDDLQLFLGEETLGPAYDLVEDLDLGDIVGAEGEVVSTRRGELSVKASSLTLLTKALRPLPEKWHGLQDPDLRVRRRYLDFATSLESRRVIHARAGTLKAIRARLDEMGFLEVETPVLQISHGGALARPFVTHHETLDVDLYLRIAPELYLKRLLVGGLERVYEIGRNFRNEGIDWDHNPEFTMLEIYQAYGDYEDMMLLAEELITAAARVVRGALGFDYQGRALDLTPPWARRALLELVSEAVGQEVALDRPDLGTVADRAGVHVDPAWKPGRVVWELYEKLVEPDLWGPVFVKDMPKEVSPLARPHRSAPGLTEHVDLVIAGTEIGPAYSELTDPDDQRARFVQQQERRRGGDEEAHPLDEDFLTALEHGMPPAGGIGIGIDRVTMILADAPTIRDVILFPHHRPDPGR